jgi:hypothetical protein
MSHTEVLNENEATYQQMNSWLFGWLVVKTDRQPGSQQSHHAEVWQPIRDERTEQQMKWVEQVTMTRRMRTAM